MKSCGDKRKYIPNVNDFLALCGRNYVLILNWLPNDKSKNWGTKWRVEGCFGVLEVKLLENTPYTQLVEISRPTIVGKTASSLIETPKVIVRIYHDAQLAEVLTMQQISRLSPVYDYPNVRMYQRDEKYQVNAFLEELLKIGRQAKRVCLT